MTTRRSNDAASQNPLLYLVGKRIREVRQYRRMSQQKLADLMEAEQGTISHAELGDTNLTLLNLADYAQALEVPLEYLVREASDQLYESDRNKPVIGYHSYSCGERWYGIRYGRGESAVLSGGVSKDPLEAEKLALLCNARNLAPYQLDDVAEDYRKKFPPPEGK